MERACYFEQVPFYVSHLLINHRDLQHLNVGQPRVHQAYLVFKASLTSNAK